MKINWQKGETLVEAIIALAIAVAIATGIVAAVLVSLSGSDTNRASNAALNYAQEGSDHVKDAFATNTASFIASYPSSSPNSYYFLGDDETLSTTFTPCPSTNDATYNLLDPTTQTICEFRRTVYINHQGYDCSTSSRAPVCNSNALKCTNATFTATVVSWTDSKCKNGTNCHNVEIDSCLANINALPTPNGN